MSKEKLTRSRGLNKQKMFATIAGWGINDADYKVRTVVNGKVTLCPFYRKWITIISRAYSEKSAVYRPPLVGNSIHSDWKYFSAFKLWMESKVWFGLEIDKDIIVKGNKEYGPTTCCFVPKYINMLISPNNKNSTGLPLGAVASAGCVGRYNATSQGGKSQYLGSFGDPMEAHRVWCLAKAKHIEDTVERWRMAGISENFSYTVAEKLIDRAVDLRLNAQMKTEVKSV